eukprot:TRINITY_DN20066_c0_g1_i1.p1 TRINITY_DN20066_c0_g1~~TRINITY_DN20066_c0_g1_i1.p1  ORF type:complete len:240 (+),score=33.42 TRINITY_DN20066_c0_g1_i1:28-747(+)
MVLGLIIQQLGGHNLFLHTKLYLPNHVGLQISKEFASQIAVIRRKDLGSEVGNKPAQPNYRSGSIVLFKQYRVLYQLVNHEFYVVAISHKEDNSFDGLPWLNKAKRVLFAACRGADVTSVKTGRYWSEIFFGLERTLICEDGAEIITQKLSDISPFGYSQPNHSAKSSITSSIPFENLVVNGQHNWDNCNVQFDDNEIRFSLLNNIQLEEVPQAFKGNQEGNKLVPYGPSFKPKNANPS